MMMAIIIQAGEVLPEQALQQAVSFLQQRAASGMGPKKSPARASELTMAGRFSGLYVINTTGDNGYLIVSNDDRTTPILGYSNSGSLDLENMPDNMRAWLQGYADEIAWLDAHSYQPTATRRAASGVKTPIAPLVTTQWDQDAPYNNQVTSYYPAGGAVTGCVATAMAQVMYYTAQQAGLTTTTTLADIPGYQTRWGSNIPGISAGTDIHWDKMLDSYAGDYSAESANAVATLMRCCGVSVKMDYGNTTVGGSSALSDKIPTALITYFGYAATTKLAVRSHYSYANWIEMLYHELAEGRAIIYAGQSTGGGHEFVCDGYQGEDYFHINWGWSGMCDSYFKLSALDPDEQGIGGSTSSEGYRLGQNAVVGVQLEGGTGTVLDNPNIVNLTLNDVSADKTSISIGETAIVTFNMTNNSTDDYDGEIGFFFLHGDEGSLGDGKMIQIPAGATQDCAVEFVPAEAGTYKITAYKMLENGYYQTYDETKYVVITVTDGGAGAATDNVNLTLGVPTVENTEAIGDGNYNLYGNFFKATVRITNSTATDYSGMLFWRLLPSSNTEEMISLNNINMTIPHGSYVDIPLEVDGLDGNETYYKLYVGYRKNGNVSPGSWRYYYLNPAITTYAADGTLTVTKASSTSYTAPANALAVDLTGTNVTAVSGGAANCLFISDKTLTGVNNVVTKSGTTYTAANITLTDGCDFFSPVDFTASNIEFTYDNDRWADNTGGWNTIILPFDVASVTADGTPIDWFHNATDYGKQFWLKAFTGDDTSAPKVYFDYATSMEANTPYIIALPGNHWGEANNLSGKTIKFIGTNAEVKKSEEAVITASNYRFVGDTKAVSTENIYCINAAGNKFELKTTGGSAAFRPFFKADIFDRNVTSLGMGHGESTTDIVGVTNTNITNDTNIYDLQGRKVKNAAKGIYIVNGRKVVIK